VGLGSIVRHTAGGIAALVGLIFLPAILGVLPAPWGARIARFTLLDAARQVTALHPATDLFAPAASLLVLLAWPALTLLAAAFLITRRDALKPFFTERPPVPAPRPPHPPPVPHAPATGPVRPRSGQRHPGQRDRPAGQLDRARHLAQPDQRDHDRGRRE
jgi:hypothetical protein